MNGRVPDRGHYGLKSRFPISVARCIQRIRTRRGESTFLIRSGSLFELSQGIISQTVGGEERCLI